MKYPKHTGGVSGNESTLRGMLLQLGLNEVNASMAIMYMFMLPRTTDPDAQGVIAIIMATQRGLNKLGAKLDVDGRLGAKTARAILAVSGSGWYDKTWVQITGDVLEAIKAGRRLRDPSPSPSFSSVGAMDMNDVKNISPLVWIGGGAILLYLWSQ